MLRIEDFVKDDLGNIMIIEKIHYGHNGSIIVLLICKIILSKDLSAIGNSVSILPSLVKRHIFDDESQEDR